MTTASIDGARLTLTLSEALDPVSQADPSDFAVELGDSSIDVTTATISGATFDLTLASAVPDVDCSTDAVTVGYTQSGSTIVNAAGVELADFSAQPVTNLTDQPPKIVSAETSENGQYIHIDFCEAIADPGYNWYDLSPFHVSRNGSTRAPDDVIRPSGKTNRLSINISGSRRNWAQPGETITISYSGYNADASPPLHDADQGMKLVPSWSALMVTNLVDGPPQLVSVSSVYDIVTMTFDEPLDEGSVPDESAFTIGGTSYAPDVDDVSIIGSTVTLTLSSVLLASSTPYTLSYFEPNQNPLREADGSHNVQDISSFSFSSSTPSTRPVVTAAEVDGASLIITFDLPLKRVAAASAFTVGGSDGVTVSAVAFTANVVTLTLSAPVGAGDSVTISYAKPNDPPRIEGRNSEEADSFSNRSVTNLTEAPAPVLSDATISADGRALSLSFSTNLDDSGAGTPALVTFSLSGTSATPTALAIDGRAVTLTLSPAADFGEIVLLSYSPLSDATEPRLRSAVGAKPVAAFSDAAVTNGADGKPRPTTASVNADQITLTFDRALNTSSTPSPTAFVLAGVSATPNTVTISGRTVTITLDTAVAHNQTPTLSYQQPISNPLTRAGQTLLVDSFTALALTNQTPDPTPRFVAANINASGATLTVIMSEPLSEAAIGTPDTSDFTIAGMNSAAVDGIEIDGSTVLLSLSPLADLGQAVSLSYTQPDSTEPALRSADGRWRAPSWVDATVTNRADGVPRPKTATVIADTLTLSFDRELNSQSVPASSAFTVTPSTLQVTDIVIAGSVVTLTLSPAVAYGETVSVGYTAPSQSPLMRDVHNLTVVDFSIFPVDNDTPKPELLQSITGDEQTITLSFTERLDTTSVPAVSSFELTPADATISSVSVASTSVSLQLSDSLSEGVAYTLTYAPPAASPLRTAAGLDVDPISKSLDNQTDVAPVIATATADAASLTITFDQQLDATVNVPASAFGIVAAAVTQVSAPVINGVEISLTLSRPLVEDESVTLNYTQPSSNGIADTSGLLAASFSATVDNQTDTPPIPVSGTVDGDLVIIVLDQALIDDPRYERPEGFPPDQFTLAGVDATVSFVRPRNDGPGGVGRLEITLSRPIIEGESVTIDYFPGGSNFRLLDDDGNGNRAEINHYPLINLADFPPTVVSASVDGVTITVTFDQALDEDQTAPVTAFTLGDEQPAVSSIALSGKIVTLTLAKSVLEDEALTLSYTPPAEGRLSDKTGNLVAAFSQALDNLTDYAPYPVSVQTDEEGLKVFISFDQSLEESGNLDIDWFNFDPPHPINQVLFDVSTVERRTLIIDFKQNVRIGEGMAVSVSYTAPTSGGLQDDDAGLAVASFTRSVTSQVDVAPLFIDGFVQSQLVTLNFDQDLDEDAVPPADCDQLRKQDEDLALIICGPVGGEEPTWFRVWRVGDATLDIESVTVTGDQVSLTLSEPVSIGDSIAIEYTWQTEPDGHSWKLRDEGGNEVGNVDPMSIENITAAAALSANLDRAEPRTITVTFDGPLASDSLPAIASLSVSVDGQPQTVSSVAALERELTVTLQSSVPQCTTVSIGYSADVGEWLDAAAHPILSFDLPVPNLLDTAVGLRCLYSDYGGIVLTFASELGEDAQNPKRWRLWVHNESRQFKLNTKERSSGGQVVSLLADPSICVGDAVRIQLLDRSGDALWELNRTIDSAAPCAQSAMAMGRQLAVTFDEPVTARSAQASDFELTGGSSVESIESVDASYLMLQLAEPGLKDRSDSKLSYVGVTLSDGERMVGPFALPVDDQTTAPKLVSARGAYSSVNLRFDQPLWQRAIGATRFKLLGPTDASVRDVQLHGSSVTLELSELLPDDPDIVALFYDAGKAGGLAGPTGVRVPSDVYLITNRTETIPRVSQIVADARRVRVTFNQRVIGRPAQTEDFAVQAGFRDIAPTELNWSRDSVSIVLADRITALDAVEVRYEPSAGHEIRDTTGIALSAFREFAANETKRPSSIADRVADAELRASADETTLQRELARGFASTDGVSVQLSGDPGDDAAVARGNLMIQAAIADLESESVQLSATRLLYVDSLRSHLIDIPEPCQSDSVRGWWIGESDADGRPSQSRVEVNLSIGDLVPTESHYCVLDLLSNEWQIAAPDQPIYSPALVFTTRALNPLNPSFELER